MAARSEIIEKRLRKQVNYAKLNGKLSDSDDDFEVNAPPAKLKKVSKKEPTKKTLQTDPKDTKLSKRPTVSERVFERNVKEALAKSKLQRLKDDDDDEFVMKEKPKKKDSIKENSKTSNSSVLSPKSTNSTLNEDKNTLITSIDEPKVIITPDVSTISIGSSQQTSQDSQESGQASPTLVEIKSLPSSLESTNDKDDKDNFNPGVSSIKDGSSDEDDNFSPNSENLKAKTKLPKNKKARKENVQKESTPIKPKMRTVTAKIPEPQKPQTQTRGPKNSTPNVTSDLLCHVKPVNIPALGLRVGLSRKRSVKPLHPNVKLV